MAQTIGCIGCGNMGSALLMGFAGKTSRDDLTLLCHDRNPAKMDKLKQYGIEPQPTIEDLVQKAEIIIVAVKPYDMQGVLQQFGNLDESRIVISLAAAMNLPQLRNLLGPKPAVCRCMPTTTAKVGKGVFAFTFDPVSCSEKLHNTIFNLFNQLGYCVMLPENRFTAFSAFIGAGPAYIFEMMLGMAQAGLTLGFSLHESRQMILELFAGAALMGAHSTESFLDLRNEVCSPGGLTIAGINKLDRAGFTGLIVEAVQAAEKRGREME